MPADDFDVNSLAAYLHLSPQQVTRLADRGKLPGRKVAGQWRFSRAEIHHWLENRIGLSEEDDLVDVEDVLRSEAGPETQEEIVMDGMGAGQAAAGLATVDLIIIFGFLLLVTIIGFLMSKAASKGMEDYFLGGNKIPWWVLGASTATSNFDMSGTMIIVAVVFALGFKGFLVEIDGNKLTQLRRIDA